MGAKLNIITSLIAFVLLISLIPVIFNLNSYYFIVVEIIAFVILLIIGTASIIKLVSGKNSWYGLFVFFFLNAINLFVIYARTMYLKELIIPFIAVIIGLYITALNINSEDTDEYNEDVEPYYESEELNEEKPKKKTAKKKAKKK